MPRCLIAPLRVQDALLSAVKELVHNRAFVDFAIHEDLIAKVRQAVESQSSILKKGSRENDTVLRNVSLEKIVMLGHSRLPISEDATSGVEQVLGHLRVTSAAYFPEIVHSSRMERRGWLRKLIA